MKKTRTLLLTAIVTLFAFSTVLVTSCHKAKQNSTLLFENNTFTQISLTVNGSSTTIPSGGTASFIGNVGSNVNVHWTTSGTYGLVYTQDFSDNFPVDGGVTGTEPLDVDASYFYLEVTNSDPHRVTDLYVNYGLTAQTHENVSIPNDGNTYGMGYYSAFANTDVSVTYSDGYIYTTSSLNIPNISDASYNLFLN